jgi:hypothetical protein
MREDGLYGHITAKRCLLVHVTPAHSCHWICAKRWSSYCPSSLNCNKAYSLVVIARVSCSTGPGLDSRCWGCVSTSKFLWFPEEMMEQRLREGHKHLFLISKFVFILPFCAVWLMWSSLWRIGPSGLLPIKVNMERLWQRPKPEFQKCVSAWLPVNMRVSAGQQPLDTSCINRGADITAVFCAGRSSVYSNGKREPISWSLIPKRLMSGITVLAKTSSSLTERTTV